MAFKNGAPRSKYGNIKVEAQGQKFGRVGERDRFFYLSEAQREGRIRNLKSQVPYTLTVNGYAICKYIADFVYEIHYGYERRIETIVEDFKGIKTKEYILKEKLMLACHGIKIKVVKTPTDLI